MGSTSTSTTNHRRHTPSLAVADRATKRRRDKFARLLHQFHATAHGAKRFHSTRANVTLVCPRRVEPLIRRGQTRVTATSSTTLRCCNILNDANQSRTWAANRSPNSLDDSSPAQQGACSSTYGMEPTAVRSSLRIAISDLYYAAFSQEAFLRPSVPFGLVTEKWNVESSSDLMSLLSLEVAMPF